MLIPALRLLKSTYKTVRLLEADDGLGINVSSKWCGAGRVLAWPASEGGLETISEFSTVGPRWAGEIVIVTEACL